MDDSPWLTRPDGTPGEAMAGCLGAAITAPSIHNTQPWLFRPHGSVVDVLVDRRRQLVVADPQGREMHVSVGAALFNLRTAMLAAARMPVVRLLPVPDEPDVVAPVSVGPAVPISADTRSLADAIPLRQTTRRPFWSARIPGAVLSALTATAEAHGARHHV